MIWIYEQGFEDFSTNGLGQLHPVRCHLSEEQAGAYELELEHPISDDLLSWELIKTGRVIKVPVPAQTTPLIHMEGAAGYEVWKTNRATKVYTKKTTSMGTRVTQESPDPYHEALLRPDVVKVKDATSVTVWKSNGNRVLESLENNAQVTVLKKDGAWYRITTAKGATGWVQAAHVTLVQTVPDTPPETIQERKTRDQLFRIYRAEKDTAAGVVKAWARHISYDLLANVLISCKVEDVTVSAAIAAINTACTQTDHGFTVYTNSTAKVTADWSRKGYLEALLDPEEGLAALANLRVVRDNYDIFLLERSTTRRQAITHGRNLLGVSVDISEDGVVNRIIPVGKTKDGKVLHIDATYVDSPRNGEGTIIRAKVIEYEVAEKEARDGQPAVTLAQAKAKLVQLANADFEAGIDLPDISVKVDFLLLGDTEEYKAYRDLDRLYLGDIVTVISDVHQVSLEAEVTRVEYSPLSGTYLGMEVGVTDAARTIGSTASFMLPNGSLGGRKIAMGSLDGSRFQNLSIGGIKIKHAAIDYVHATEAFIQALKADAVIATRGEFERLVTDELEADELWANVAHIARIAARTADIDFLKVKDVVAGTGIFRQGVGDALYLDRLVVNDANFASAIAGKLMIRDTDGKLYRISVNSSGAVTATQVQVNGDSLTDNAVMSVSQRLLWRQATQPSAPWVGMLWLDTTTEKLKRCTAITPSVAWEVVPAGEVHTAVIDVDDNGMNILSGGNLNLLSGGAINIKNLGNTANVINMDSTGLTLSSTGQLKLTSADSIVIGGSPFSVGGTNLLTDTVNWVTGWSQNISAPSYAYVTTTVENGQPIGCLVIAANMSGGTLAYKDQIYYCQPNTTYTLSCGWLTSTSTFIFFREHNGTQYLSRKNLTSASKSATLTTSANAQYLQVVVGVNPGEYAYVKDIKLEKGTMATDWSPSPSDPASGVKTSHIDIATDHIDISSGGNLSITSPNTLKITSGTTNATALAVRNDTDYFISAGHLTQSSAPFWIKKDGSIKATSGTIGGFTIGSNSLSAQPSGKPLLKLDTANSKIQIGVLEILGISGPYGDAGSVGTGSNELNLVGEPVTINSMGLLLVEITDSVAWFRSNVSALSFTDRTIGYDGNAVADLKRIRNDKDGNIDHSTLPTIAKRTIQAKGKTEEGRDLGAMISILTKAVQELDERLEKIEDRIK